jgi:RNA polymerase sigma-70 factor (ECF subfamily)
LKVWPGVRVSNETFSARVQELGITAPDLSKRASDIFLAIAGLERDDRALRHFDKTILADLDLHVGRYALQPAALDDVRQKIRLKLLVGPPPAIRGYRGTGPLGAWVRVAAVRIAADLKTGETLGGGRFVDGALAAFRPAFGDSPEIAAIKHRYHGHLRDALEQTLQALPAREKTLLRLTVVDGLNIDAIGAIYRVHRATVARWLVQVRAQVFAGIRERIGLRNQPTVSELRSLLVLLADEVHLSARRILAPT